MDQGKPSLALVEDPADTDVVDASPTPTVPATPPEPAPQPITIAQQITNYSALVSRLKKDYHLAEGTVVKLTELALNERFTLIQMGLAGPRASTPATEEDPADGNTDQSEG